MAKKLETDFPDFDDDLDFDFGDDTFGSLNQSVEPKKRSAVGSVVTGALEGIGDTLKNPSFIHETLRQSLPKEFGEVSENLGQIKGTLDEAYGEVQRELKPALGRIAKRIDTTIPEDSRARGISERIMRFFGANRDVAFDEPESREDQAINQTLGMIFQQTEQKDKQNQKRNILNTAMQRKQHIESTRILDDIRINASTLSQYTVNVTQAFQKKSLEIQLRSYMAQMEFNKTALRHMEATRAQNEAIIKNTGLPEYVKIKESERFKEIARTAMIQSLWGEGSMLKQGLQKVKSNVSDMVQGARWSLENLDLQIESMQDAGQQLEEFNQILAEMGMPPMTKSQMAGAMIGAEGTSWARNKITPHIRKLTEANPRITEFLHQLARRTRNPVAELNKIRDTDFYQNNQYDYDGFGGKLIRGFESLLDGFGSTRVDRSYGRTGLTDHNEVGFGFDKKAHVSLVEIIPGYLSMIHQELMAARAGGDPNQVPRMVFDYGRNQFVTDKTMMDNISKEFEKEMDSGYYKSRLEDASSQFFTQSLTEFEKAELNIFLARLARKQGMDYSADAIQDTSEYQSLSPNVRKSVNALIDQFRDSDRKEEERNRFDKALDNIRSAMPTADRTMRKYSDMGYQRFLEATGVGTVDEYGRFRIDEDRFDEYLDATIDATGRGTSDINVKKNIERKSPIDAMLSFLGNMKERIGQRGSNRASWESLRNTPMYDWEYKDGMGSSGKHTGPMAQDVLRNFGSEAAPGGKQIDLISLNGATMGAVQHLGQQVEALQKDGGVSGKDKLTTLEKIERNTRQTATNIQQITGGISTGIGQVQSPQSYTDHLSNLFGSIFGLGAKAGGDTLSLAGSAIKGIGKGIKGAYENILAPGGAAVKEAFKRNKEKIEDAFSGLLGGGIDLTTTVFGWGKNFITKMIPESFRSVSGFLSKSKVYLKELYQEQKDLYLPGGLKPVIEVAKLKAGFYRNAVTGQVILTMTELLECKDDIVDSLGNVVLSVQDKAKGLYDKHGTVVKTFAAKAFDKAIELGIRAKERIMGGLNFLKERLSVGKDYIKAKVSGFDMGNIGIGNAKVIELLTQIRDLMLGRKIQPDGPNDQPVHGQLFSEASSNPEEEIIEETSGQATPAAESRYGSGTNVVESMMSGTGLSGTMLGRGAGWLMGKWKGRGKGKLPSGLTDPNRAALLQAPAGIVAGKADGGILGLGRGRGILSGIASLFGGEQVAETSTAPVASEQTSDQSTGQTKTRKRVKRRSERKAELAWNDTDGDGRRDGSVEDQHDKIAARAESRKKDPAEAPGPRYQHEGNVIDSAMAKIGGIFSSLTAGISNLFGSATDALDSIPGMEGSGRKGGGKPGAGKPGIGQGAARGAAKRGIFRTAAGWGLRAGLGLGKWGLTTALPAIAKVGGGLLLKGGSLLAAGLASPFLIKGAIAAAVGYGIWRLYKYATRNSASELEQYRLMQYGLTVVDSPVFHHVYGLEAYLQDGRLLYRNDEVSLNTQNIKPTEILELFGIGEKDEERQGKLLEWYRNRFLPVFFKHMAAFHAVNPKETLDKADKLKPEEKLKYLEGTRDADLPYDVVTSPFENPDVLTADKDTIDKSYTALHEKIQKEIKKPKDPFKAKIEEAEKKVQETKKKRVLDQQKRQQTLESGFKNQVIPVPKPIQPSGPQAEAITGNQGEDGEKTTVTIDQESAVQSHKPGILQTAGGQILKGHNGYAFLKPGNDADFDNMDPNVKKLFLGMAEEYGQITGKSIPINEAFRSRQRQEELYRKYGSPRAAKPGSSLHEFGLAIDIPSAVANELEELGLMRKYGFTRPVATETWHLEPAGIQRDLNAAKHDLNLREQMVLSSQFKGGGGIGTLKDYKGKGRDQAYALSLLNANDRVVKHTKLTKDTEAQNASLAKQITAANDDRNEVSNLPRPQVNDVKLAQIGFNVQAGGDGERPQDTVVSSMKTGEDVSIDPELGQASASQEQLMEMIRKAAVKTGVSPDILTAMAIIESDLNPNAKAKSSSASGLMQFLRGTWNETLSRHGRKHGLSAGVSPFDPYASALMGGEYLRANLKSISSLRPNPSIVDAYLTHFLGPGGARTFLSADPDARGSDVLPRAAGSNPAIFFDRGRPRTIKEIYKLLGDRFVKKTASYGLRLNTGGLGLRPGGSEPGLEPNEGALSSPRFSSETNDGAQYVTQPTMPDRIKSEHGGFQIDPHGSSQMAKEYRATAQAGVGPDLAKLESTAEQSLNTQKEMVDVLKSILTEVNAQTNAQALAEILTGVLARQQEPSLKEQDRMNLNQARQTKGSALDTRRRSA